MKQVLFILSFFPLLVQAQDLTGTWVGHSAMDYVKLVIVHRGDSILGYTYDEGPGWCKASFSGVYDSKSKFLKGKGMEMLHQSGSHGLGIYFLDYFKKDGLEMLNGRVASKRSLQNFFSLGGSSQIFLHKESNKVDTLDFMRPFIASSDKPAPEVATTQVPSKKQTDTVQSQPSKPATANPSITTEKKARISKLVQKIVTNADSIKIALYDNGEVDQDSVTIFFDNAIILNRYMITNKPMELTLALPKDGKEHSLELFAHNLGNIPPNTALVIITAGNKRYELRASYDLNSNARIIFSQSPPAQ